MTDILREIVAHKESEVAQLNAAELRRAASVAPAPRDFLSAVSRQPGLAPRLIAELKLASPSKGMLAPGMDTRRVADIYAQNGAAAISVLTDQRYFLGKLETLRDLRITHRSPLPLLRKDFIIAESQIYESRANGADAILLIVAALNYDARLAGLHSLALGLGLTALVEVHNEREAERALGLRDIRLMGINNRDLTTFRTSLETTERLLPLIPESVHVISESGIASAADVERLADRNVDAILVGEALVTASDIAAKVRELASVSVKSI